VGGTEQADKGKHVTSEQGGRGVSRPLCEEGSGQAPPLPSQGKPTEWIKPKAQGGPASPVAGGWG